jgi:polyisoprenoid-binding protein YceI
MPTTNWKLDTSHSTVEFTARHMMLTKVKGRFSDVEGTVTTDGDTPASASVNVTIKTASIDTRTEMRDNHLRSPDFLDAEQYPVITFQSTKIDGAKDQFAITGDLTIHGVTRPVTLDVSYEGAGKDPWGNDRLGFTASGAIDRREFGLTWNQALETGGVLVSNEIRINIDAQLTRVENQITKAA